MSIPASSGPEASPELEDVAPPPAEGATSQELEALRRELDAARQRINELAYALQASERDREAFKERQRREREQLLDVERGNVALALLEAVDELERCLQSADESPLAVGVRMIRDGMLKRAEATGLERVELLGRPFDPNLAEAGDMEITGDEAEDGRVTGVLKACYQLNGRTVRPGVVKVARYVKPGQA
jgi:molecular chaperone GrpE